MNKLIAFFKLVLLELPITFNIRLLAVCLNSVIIPVIILCYE